MKKDKLLSLPKVILFDWDNTLVDSFGLIASTMNKTLVEFGHNPWTWEELRLRIQRSGRESLPLYFGEKAQEAGQSFYHHYQSLSPSLSLLPGAYELLEVLAQQGVKMGIVSNKNPEFIKKETQTLKVNSFFSVCLGSGETEQDKPAPDPIFLALKKLDQKPGKEEVWFVGDAPVDWICAEAAGCFSVAIGDFDLSTIKVDLSVANCTELKKMLWIS